MRAPIGVGLIAFAAASFVKQARADGFYWSLTYEPSVPIGSIRKASNDISAAGGALGARYLFTDHWSLGIGGHFNQFAKNYDSATYPIENGAITGSSYRKVWVGSLLAEAHAYLKPDAAINPYFGIGVGMSWMSNQLLVSDLPFEDLSRGFTFCPEAGILIAFDRDVFDEQRTAMQSALIGVRYTYSAAGSRDVSSTSFLSLSLGLLVY